MRVEQIENGGLEEAGQAVERALGVEAAGVADHGLAFPRSVWRLHVANSPSRCRAHWLVSQDAIRRRANPVVKPMHTAPRKQSRDNKEHRNLSRCGKMHP